MNMATLSEQIQAGLPLLVMAAGIVIVMLQIGMARNHALTTALSVLTLLAAAASTLPLSAQPVEITPLLLIDAYARFAMLITALGAAATSLLLYRYLESLQGIREEMQLLLLIATLGALALCGAQHAASLLLGLETMSVALFGMIAYPHLLKRPLEAGIKYLVLSAAASATMLFGFALVYAAAGGLAFPALRTLLPGLAGTQDAGIAVAGFALVWVGFAFKLSLVPFHLWTADVYEGAPAPVTGFLASVSKGVVAVILLRWLDAATLASTPYLRETLAVLTVATILYGNLAALLQQNVKRILAFSSIGHFGYLMVPFLVGGEIAGEAVLFYVAAYYAMTLGSFAVVTVISNTGGGVDADRIDQYRGLFWQRPWLATGFTLMMLAQAGIPLTLGFLAKFYVIAAAADQHAWWLAMAIVVGSAIGLYYYLRLIAVQLQPAENGQGESVNVRNAGWAAGAALVGLTLAVMVYGILPQPLAAGVADALSSLR